MVFLGLVLVALGIGGAGIVLTWLMHQIRHLTPYSRVFPMVLATRLLALGVLMLYGVPALIFSGVMVQAAAQNGPDVAFDQHKELVAAMGVAGIWFGTLGFSLFFVSMSLQQVEQEGRSLRNNPFVLIVLVIGAKLLIMGILALTIGTLFGGVLIVMGGLRYLASRQAERRAHLLWTLTLAAEGRRSLADDMRQVALGRWGVFAAQVNYAASLLDAGYSLPAALEAVPGLLPEASLLTIRIGDEAGDLRRALREATLAYTMGARERLSQQMNVAMGFRMTMALSTILGGFFLLQMMMIFIIPKYKLIFGDFGIELPSITRALIDLSDGMIRYFWAVGPLAATVIALLTYAGWMLLTSIDVSRAIEWTPWAWIRPRIATGPILRCLAVVVRLGRPITGSLGTLADNFPLYPLRPRLRGVASDVTRGQNVWVSLEKAGLLKPEEVEVLFAADRAGNLAWALDALAAGMERRSGYRIMAFLELVQPAMIICAGVAVMIIDVAFFMPLVQVLGELS